MIRLNLESNDIGNDGATALAMALYRNMTLTTLSFWNNKIGNFGAKALSEALDTNTTLLSLDIEYNNVGDDNAWAITTKLQRNVDSYDVMFWQPAWHSDFPAGLHDLVFTTLLCNEVVGEKKLPRLPLVVWKEVFSFYCRKAFY